MRNGPQELAGAKPVSAARTRALGSQGYLEEDLCVVKSLSCAANSEVSTERASSEREDSGAPEGWKVKKSMARCRADAAEDELRLNGFAASFRLSSYTRRHITPQHINVYDMMWMDNSTLYCI